MKPFNIPRESPFFELAIRFSNSEKWQSYEGLNGHRYSKKVENSMSHSTSGKPY
jgi:hypothetical protein